MVAKTFDMPTETIVETTSFAPVLYLRNVADGIQFYQQAFGAVELRRFSNDDGSVHVAELQIGDALFHLHEESPHLQSWSPQTLKGTPVELGLFVAHPHDVQTKAIAAGATELNAVQDYDYGYQQGTFADPFGHHWTVQKKL